MLVSLCVFGDGRSGLGNWDEVKENKIRRWGATTGGILDREVHLTACQGQQSDKVI